MISWIVASHHYPTLRDNLAATMRGTGDDEVVVVENATSIAAAYNEGQDRARNPIRCYVHHDVRILDARRLRAELVDACTSQVGMVGVVGSRTAVWPWWDGLTLGSVVDGRMGVLNLGSGGPCAVLDGLLLATVHTVQWDESYPGWHGYDHDMCAQMVAHGLSNLCLTDGYQMVHHNTDGPTNVGYVDGWAEAERRYREKWG